LSAQQQTLDGGVVEPHKQEGEPKNGFALVLWHAPDRMKQEGNTDWEQLKEWYYRLDAEGLA